MKLQAVFAALLAPTVAFAYGSSYTSLELQRKKALEKQQQQQQSPNQRAATHVDFGGGGTTGGYGGYRGAGAGSAGDAVSGFGSFSGGLGKDIKGANSGGGSGGGGGGGGGSGGGGFGGLAAGNGNGNNNSSSLGGGNNNSGSLGSGGIEGGNGDICPPNAQCASTGSGNNNSTGSHSSTLACPSGTYRNGQGVCVHSNPPPVPTCFVAGTPVATPAGERAIETLRVGDPVFAIDPASFALVPTRVTKVFHHLKARSERLRVTLSDGRSLEVTDVHRFYDPARRAFHPIGEFSQGDRVVMISGFGERQALEGAPPSMLPAALRARALEEPGIGAPRLTAAAKELTIVSIERLGNAPTDVFNIEVDARFHDYLADGILVHNMKPRTYTP